MEEPPLFCCCQFVDRHGRTAHLLDLSFCDAYAGECRSSLLRELISDLDDRLRFPQYNGAIYLGCEGSLPLVLLPLLAGAASRGPFHTITLLLLLLPLFAFLHRKALRERRRSRFFVSWCAASLAYSHAAFTIRIGEDYAFGWWLATTLGHVGALLCSAAARELPPSVPKKLDDCEFASDPECEGLTAQECKERGASQLSSLSDAEAEPFSSLDGLVEAHPHWVACPLCGHRIPGYDHHCIYLDACIGSHNRSYFIRGLVLSLATILTQVGLCLDHAIVQVGADWTWGLELACASYGSVVAIGIGALLVEQAWLLGHGLTRYEARCMRRQGLMLPPWIGCCAWLRALRSLIFAKKSC